MNVERVTTSRLRLLVALALVAGLVLTGCSNDEGGSSKQSPQQVLAHAKSRLDKTSGVHVVLATDELPPKVSGILRADGVGTHAPAFKGTLKVRASGISADAGVLAVDGDVYAKLPFTTDFTKIDPADYGAPDPADLMSTDHGLSSLLTAMKDAKKGKDVREGKQVLTEYTGTVPGDVVAGIIPTASADSDFEATFTVTDDDVLDTAVLTGPFYPGADDVSYTITFDRYDTSETIKAP